MEAKRQLKLMQHRLSRLPMEPQQLATILTRVAAILTLVAHPAATRAELKLPVAIRMLAMAIPLLETAVAVATRLVVAALLPTRAAVEAVTVASRRLRAAEVTAAVRKAPHHWRRLRPTKPRQLRPLRTPRPPKPLNRLRRD